MSTSTNNNKSPHYSYVERSPSGYVADYAELVCDLVSDLAHLPTSKSDIAIGSRCLCMEDGKTYVLSNAREWVEDLGAANQGGYPEPEGVIDIVANGKYDVKDCKTARVEVPASAVVSGSKSIVANGTYDITDYALASVNVPASAVVSGRKNITANGTYDITDYAEAKVDVASVTPFSDCTAQIVNSTTSPIYIAYIDLDTLRASNSCIIPANGGSIEIPLAKSSTVYTTYGTFFEIYTYNLTLTVSNTGSGTNVVLVQGDVPSLGYVCSFSMNKSSGGVHPTITIS